MTTTDPSKTPSWMTTLPWTAFGQTARVICSHRSSRRLTFLHHTMTVLHEACAFQEIPGKFELLIEATNWVRKIAAGNLGGESISDGIDALAGRSAVTVSPTSKYSTLKVSRTKVDMQARPSSCTETSASETSEPGFRAVTYEDYHLRGLLHERIDMPDACFELVDRVIKGAHG